MDRGLELEAQREDSLDQFERQLSSLWPLTIFALLMIFVLILLSLPTKNGSSDIISPRRSGSFLR